jgi:hypothetical protein
VAYNQHDGTDRWEQNAGQWHRIFGSNDPSRIYLLDPLILRILGNVSDKHLLDAGCGDGYLSRAARAKSPGSNHQMLSSLWTSKS